MMDAEIGGPGPSGRRIVVEFDWTHFTTPAGWCNITQVAVGLLAICCTGPGTFATQIYFMFISIVAFLGAILLCLLHFKFFNFNRHGKCIEFAYTATMGFFYLTAWVALFCDLGPWEQPDYSHRWGAQIAAGVFGAMSDVTLLASLYFLFSDAQDAYNEIIENQT